MKKILLTLAMAVMAVTAANAKSASEIRIYINPGHGAWTGEDRPMALVNKAIMDTTGFFESNTNLKVGLAMWEKLKEYGLRYTNTSNALLAGGNNVVMSRVKNGPNTCPSGSSISYGGSTYGQYSRNLSEIAIECHTNNFDMFISPHSNAFADGQPVNYPLILYRGTDAAERSAGSKAMCQAMWPYAYSDAHQQWSATSTYNPSKPNIRGDVSFMGGDYSTVINGVAYWGYYGVLRQGTPGFLIERYFHTYQPARHRAMNWEACYIQGYLLARGVAAYWGLTPSTNTGEIFGVVRSATETFSHTYYTPMSGSDDQYLPLNGVKVTLKNSSGTVVNTQQINQNGTASTVSYKTTDNFYNGVFVFRGLAPGNYTVTLEKSGYDTKTVNVTVNANQTTYPSVFMSVSGQHIDPYDPGTGYYNYYDDKMAGGWPLNYRLNYAQQPTVSSLDNRNSFAYDVATSLTTAGVKVRYRLAGVATAVTVRIYNSSGTQVASASGTRNAVNEVEVSLSGQPDGIYKAKVEVTSANHGWAACGTTYRFFSPWGVTCNNCTESPTFGRVLCLESNVNVQTRTSTNPYHSGLGVTGSMSGSGNGMGIYAFTAQGLPMWHDAVAANPTYAPNTSTNTQRNYYSFRAGLVPVASSNAARQLDFKRIKFSDDGRLFLSRTNNDQTVATLYELNPNNLEETAHPVFSGAIDAYGSIGGNGVGPSDASFVANQFVGFDVFGNGPNLKIAAVGINMTTGKSALTPDGVGIHYNTYNWANISIYNLGTARSWSAHPSQILSCAGTWCDESSNIALNANGVALAQRPRDNNGNLMTTGSSDKPNYAFYNTSLSRTTYQTSERRGGGIAWNKDRTRLAISSSSGDGKVSIYTVSSTGALTEQTSYTIGGNTTYVCALAWDYADNLYVTSNMSESLQCFSTPTVSGSTRTVTTPAAAYYDIDWRHPDAYNPSANYYVANVEQQWSKAGNIGARSFGLTSDIESKDKKFYFLSQFVSNGTQTTFQGHFAGFSSDATNWNASNSSNTSGETYLLDFMATSDDAGNLLFLGVKHGSAWNDKEIITTGSGQGSTKAMIIPYSSAGIKKTSVASNQSISFDIGSTKISDRGQFLRGTGDFSSALGGNYWILPYGGASIYKGGFKNVTTSGGERLESVLIPTGLSNATLGGASLSYLNSVTPYTDTNGNQRALVCLFNEGIYDGPIENNRFLPTLVSSTARHAQGVPSMFMLQDRKLLVCPTGSSQTATMGLFEVSNDAAGHVTMTQVGSNFTPFSGTLSVYNKGGVTRVVPIDDLTADIYISSSPVGISVYRVRLEPEPVVNVSTEIINNYTSQAKKLTWTTKANTSPVGFLIEVSTDGGATWTTISSPKPRAGSDSPDEEGDPNNTGSMREFTDTDASRATADCQYRVSAIYDSFTSIARHTAIPKNQTVSKVAPSKGVTFESSQCLFKQLKTGTGMYNGSATSSAYDLYGLTGSFTWIHPQKIDNTTLFNDKVNNVEESAGHDYGFELVGYYVTIKEKNANVYLKTSDNRTLNNLYLAMSEIGSPGSNGKYHSVENVPGLKRGVQYTYTVTPVYKYQGAGSEYLGAAMSYDTPAWDYSPEPVKNLTVDTYFQADAPREEWWGDRATGHAQTVYYDIYRVEITMDDPNYVNSPGGWSSSASSSYKVYPSFHKVEVNKGNGVWVPLTDMPYEYLSGADGAVISTYPNQAGVNCSYNRTFTKDGFGYFMGGNFGSNYNYSYGTYSFNNHRKKPDEGFSKDVNIGFYYFICNGVNKAHSLGHIATPRATGEKTPDQWEYRVTSYYGSSSTVQSSGTNYTPDPSFADSAVATASSGAPVITGVEAPTFQADGLRVYPNPTQGELNLASNEPIQSIRIVSIAGALMRSIDGNYQNTQTIDISSLVAGNYFVIVNNQKPVHVIKR